MPLTSPRIRDDLIYVRREEDDDVIFYVKDPVRGEFYRFNELQAALMKMLDGKRSYEEIADELSMQFEQEVPVESIPRLVARLERQYLLDISSYKFTPDHMRRRIRARLRKKGLLWREAGLRKQEAAHNPEIDLILAGYRHLSDGDPIDATSCFAAVLEVNPRNELARNLLTTIHEAYFHSLRVDPSHMLRLISTDPDALLGALDRWVGGFLFSAWGMIALGAMFVLAGALLVDLHVPTPSEVTAIDFVAAYGFYAIVMMVHELGHGFACKHYGGTVKEMGLMAYYGVALAAYCDVSDSYFFRTTRPKIVTQLAGSIAQLWIYSIGIFVCALFNVRVLEKGIVGCVVYSSIGFWTNVIPLVKNDGYYALADYLGMPGLMERAFGYCGERAKQIFLGIDPGEQRATPRERRLFVAFGVLSFFFTAGYIGFFWLTFLMPMMVRLLHGLGIFMAVMSGFSTIVRPAIGSLVALARLLVVHRKEVFTPLRTVVGLLLVAGVVGVLSYRWPMPIDGVMVVRPRQRVLVTAAEDGTLQRIEVREGQRVSAGTVLARMSNLALEQSCAETDARIAEAELRVRRMRSGARPEEIAVAAARLSQSRVANDFALRANERAQELTSAHVKSADEADRAAAAAENASDRVETASAKLALLRAGTRQEDLKVAEAALYKLKDQRSALSAQLERLVVRSPIDGIVVEPHLQDHERLALRRGQRICEVQDRTQVYAEVHLPKEEQLSRLAVGDRVELRAYGDPHHRYATRVTAIKPVTPGGESFVVVDTAPIDQPGWPTGVTGHARIYGPPRTLAYRWLGAPLVQLFDYRTWIIWG